MGLPTSTLALFPGLLGCLSGNSSTFGGRPSSQLPQGSATQKTVAELILAVCVGYICRVLAGTRDLLVKVHSNLSSLMLEKSGRFSAAVGSWSPPHPLLPLDYMWCDTSHARRRKLSWLKWKSFPQRTSCCQLAVLGGGWVVSLLFPLVCPAGGGVPVRLCCTCSARVTAVWVTPAASGSGAV